MIYLVFIFITKLYFVFIFIRKLYFVFKKLLAFMKMLASVMRTTHTPHPLPLTSQGCLYLKTLSVAVSKFTCSALSYKYTEFYTHFDC